MGTIDDARPPDDLEGALELARRLDRMDPAGRAELLERLKAASGPDQVVHGAGAPLHVVVWTGFALFVGVFFGLIAKTA